MIDTTGSKIGPPVSVGIWHGFSLVDPPINWLSRQLSYKRIDFEPDGPLGHRRVVEECQMYAYDHRGRLGFNTGLVPRVVALLGREGYRVTVEEHREFGAEHQLDQQALAGATGNEKEFAEAVAAHPMGQLEVSGMKDVVDRISLVCRLFPDARIVVAVATRQRARGLRQFMQVSLDAPIGLAFSGRAPSRSRVVVSTFAQLNAFDPRQVHVLLLANAGEAGGVAAREAVARFALEPLRVYAFTPSNLVLGIASQLSLEAMAGPVIFREAPEPTAVRVLFAPMTPHSKAPRLDGLERKRQLLWNRDCRNALIARIAQAFARRDPSALRSAGLPINDADGQWLEAAGDAIRVAVLVESAEHGVQLQRHLPGWGLRSAGAARADRQVGVRPHGRIVTLTHAAKHGIPIDVLIRADGGGFPLRLPAFPRPLKARIGGKSYLVDLPEEFDAQARRDYHQRLHGYGTQGWQMVFAFCNESTRPTEDLPQSSRRTRPRSHGNQGPTLPTPVQAPTGEVPVPVTLDEAVITSPGPAKADPKRGSYDLKAPPLVPQVLPQPLELREQSLAHGNLLTMSKDPESLLPKRLSHRPESHGDCSHPRELSKGASRNPPRRPANMPGPVPVPPEGSSGPARQRERRPRMAPPMRIAILAKGQPVSGPLHRCPDALRGVLSDV